MFGVPRRIHFRHKSLRFILIVDILWISFQFTQMINFCLKSKIPDENVRELRSKDLSLKGLTISLEEEEMFVFSVSSFSNNVFYINFSHGRRNLR